jgi:DNA-directed RNA polymerase specialized sigma24 family protein
MEKNELIDELYKKYYKYLLYIAKQTVPEAEADADDIVQNVFLNLMKSPDWLAQCVLKSDHPDELRCILRTFLRNACYKYYRRLKVMHNIFIDVSDCDLNPNSAKNYPV